ncbi:hypothetical protein BD289DRAFT_341743, partial [Coniella lustricola]
IIIVGAGVGGLTLAQALHRHHIPFHLYERQPRAHQRQGHRFRISDGAFAALHGALRPQVAHLLVATAPVQSQPNTALRYPDARLFKFEPWPASLASSVPIDRAWIRAVLETGLDAHMTYGKELASYHQAPSNSRDDAAGTQAVTVTFTDGSTARGALLVGADGIRSRVRRQLQPTRHLLDLNRVISWGRTPLT